MYCSKCGRRLDRNAASCPDCGADIVPEYCGGFWGLVKGDPKIPTIPTDPTLAAQAQTASEKAMSEALKSAKADAAKANRIAQKWEDKYNSIKKTLSVVIAVLLLFGMIQSINVSVKKHRINRLNQQLEQQDNNGPQQEIQNKVPVLQENNNTESENTDIPQQELEAHEGTDDPSQQQNGPLRDDTVLDTDPESDIYGSSNYLL